MAKSLRNQLLAAYHEKNRTEGLSFAELGRRSGLGLSGDSISRKLRDRQVMYVEDVEALAEALGVEVTTGAPGQAA